MRGKASGLLRLATFGLLVFLIAGGLVTVLLWRTSAPDRAQAHQLAAHGLSVTGYITGRDAGGHDVVDYAFSTPDGLTYRGTKTDFWATDGPAPDSGPVPVLYVSNDPRISCLCEPRDLLNQASANWLLGSMAGAGISLILSLALRRHLLK